MDINEKLNVVIEATGWGQDRILRTLTDFIEENGLSNEFNSFLKQKLVEEIEACGWENPEESIFFTTGSVPREAILARVKEPYTITASPTDAKIIQAVVNQGIDSHLEGFTNSSFDWEEGKLKCNFVPEEMPILLRRLWEMGESQEDENAESLYSSILESLNINAC